MNPESEASGVRNSWLALATKSARICSTRCAAVRSRKNNATTAGPPGSPEMRATLASNQRFTGTFS